MIWFRHGSRLIASLGLSASIALSCGGAQPEGRAGAARAPSGGTPEPESLASKLGLKKSRRKRGPRSSTGTAWRNLTFLVPDSFEGYRARSATEGHEVDLTAGMTLTTIKRAYGRENVLYELEVLDTVRCDRLRQVFNRTRDLNRDSPRAVIKALRVKGFKAVTQWAEATKVARTSVLVADRFLVNVSAKPADSTAPSLTFADKLDWPGLERLATQPSAPLEPAAEPIESAGPASPPTNDSNSRVESGGAVEGDTPSASEPPPEP